MTKKYYTFWQRLREENYFAANQQEKKQLTPNKYNKFLRVPPRNKNIKNK